MIASFGEYFSLALLYLKRYNLPFWKAWPRRSGFLSMFRATFVLGRISRMFTSAVLVALSGLLAQGELIPERPTWLNDYGVASKRGIAEQKPLAVFIGTGEAGWDKISKEGELGKEAKQLLEAHYVCVYVDMNKRAGRALAAEFAISDGVGLVISDRSGGLQAFRHDGTLKPKELERSLRRYANPDRVATSTETREDLEPRPVQPVYAPIRYAPVSVGRSC
jgi:hypothetical protein